MTLALFTHSRFFHPVRQWVQRLCHRKPVSAPSPISRNCPRSPRNNAPELIAACAVSTRASRINSSSLKPLRVVRVIEPGQSQASVGRMVISGRMADVCAELDRLVAREAMAS
jgi:hypothetical protein